MLGTPFGFSSLAHGKRICKQRGKNNIDFVALLYKSVTYLHGGCDSPSAMVDLNGTSPVLTSRLRFIGRSRLCMRARILQVSTFLRKQRMRKQRMHTILRSTEAALIRTYS